MNVNGTITLNGVNDKNLEHIWGFKAKHGNAFSFSPQVMQPNMGPQGLIYNNVQFSYSTAQGLNLITEIVNGLEGTHNAIPASR